MTLGQPLRAEAGNHPIEDHGLIGDGSTAALVGRDGSISWMCVPHFDSDPLFCSLLDHRRGGALRLTPHGLRTSKQRYEPDTGVLVTEMHCGTGVVRVTDCLTLRAGADLAEPTPAGRGEVLRFIAVLEGSVEIDIEIDPRGGATGEPRANGVRVTATRRPDLDLQLEASFPLDGLRTTIARSAGDEEFVLLRWGGGVHHRSISFSALLDATRDCWRAWSANVIYDGPEPEMVKRSAITLKLLDYLETGAIVAAPTSSLPEAIGGVRNWDYRYAWVRDAAFSVYAMRRVGLAADAQVFLGWVLDAIQREGVPRVLYTLDATQPPAERIDEELEGYRGSSPVRWGNAAAGQRQHDAYGEILDCAWQWTGAGGNLDSVWPRLTSLIDAAADSWGQPDAGIWEIRASGRPFTYSAAMCQVALDRGARLVERCGLPGDAAAWRAEAERITTAIVEDSWSERFQSFTETIGGQGGLDASLLALPLRRVIDANHPRMVASVEAITKRLGAGNGLIYRYLPDESPDGLPGDEGAFLLCSFWLVDNLAGQGRLDEAGELFASLCGRAGPLGLLPEEIDASTGAFLGNYPQAFSHVGVISSGMNLGRRLRGA